MKKTIKISFAMIISLILVACSETNSEESASNSDNPNSNDSETHELNMNLVISNSDPTYPLWEEFAQDIEEMSEGTLEIEIYTSESLGDTTDMIESISQGTPVLQDSDPTHLSEYVPDYSIYMHPYLFTQPEDIEKTWQSDIGKRLDNELEEQGLKVVTAVYFGTRHLLSDNEVVTRDDTQGMKIRNAPTTMWNEVSKTLGGEPTNTAFSETYSALSQGVVDAAESPLSLLYSAKLFETKERISLTGHLVATTTIVMSKDVYESLPEQAQYALDEVGKNEPAKRVQEIPKIEDEYRNLMEEEGIIFNETDKDSFIEASKGVSDAFPSWSDNLYEDVKNAID